MPVIPKIAGATSILASLHDIHKTAMIYSRQEQNKAEANCILAKSLGGQKADYISYKDAKRKNWTERTRFFSGVDEGIASAKGYIKGAIDGIIRYIPKFVLSAVAIIPKDRGKTLSYISTIALAGYEIWDYLRYGTGLFEKTDYLERK